jgi:4-methyl-5(b-hydroxyethyl)-thiazole monophosphate biosynthesis
MSRVLVPLANGFEEIEAINIIDVLRRAKIEVLVASLDENSAVMGAHDVRIISDMRLEEVEIESLDMIVLPGGWGGTLALCVDKTVQNILKVMNEKGKNIGAICAAPLALERAGVLKHDYTCYPTIEDQIRKEGFDETKMVVQDGNIMTSRGPATAMCFALEIVKKLKGEKVYKDIKNALLADFCE